MWKKENLRKNFLRVKQMADQNLGRAEKSEVLTEDQQGSERRVEIVRQVSHNLIKKVTALLEAPPGTDPEKRLKKLPETSLSHTFLESANLLGAETLLGRICQECGDCQSTLALAELQCELNIEREVLGPLQTIAEVDIPSILKHRKHLNKSTLDMDSAKSRHHSALRQSQVPGANLASAAAKADAVRDEYDDACNKVETIKDNLSIELCNFIAKESEHSSRIVALLESQKAYHKKALEAIEEMIPKMKHTINSYPIKPMFGTSLEEHLRTLGRDISQLLEDCILTLLETGMEEEGLFRIAGSALKLKKLRACFDAHAQDMDEFSTDPHTVAGVLKQYLRELPEPLLTFDLCQEFMHATQLPQDQRLKSLQATVNKLPPANYNNLRYLVKFLALLAEKSQINKMTPSNIAIVMGPNLLWARGETAPNMMTAGAVSAIIEALIVHADFFFPGELDFHLTGRGCAPPSPSMANPSIKEAPMVTVSDPQAKPDAAEMEKGPELKTMTQGTGDSTPVQSTTSETVENLTQPDSASLDRGSESSGEVVFGGVGPGDPRMSSPRCGDGVLRMLVPPPPPPTPTNNFNSLSSSSAHHRFSMPPPSSTSGFEVGDVKPNLSLLSMAASASSSSSLLSSNTSPTSPSQSVHSDMYSTLFALHSLGEGEEAWSNYRTRVRALWDGQFQSATLLPSQPSKEDRSESSSLTSPTRAGRLSSSHRADHQSPSPPIVPSEPGMEASSEKGRAAVDSSTEECQGRSPKAEGSQDMDFPSESGSYSPDSPGHELRPEAPVNIMSASSPSVVTYSPATNTSHSSLNSATPAANSVSPTTDSPEGPQLSPKIQRRQTKKPAPPPPPDRGYNVAVTASMSKGTGNGGMTWPRNVSASSSEASSDHGPDGEKRHSPPERRISGHDRPHGPPPERPSGPPPERPKVPPPIPAGAQQLSSGAPGGHQRSSSAGAMYIITTTGPNAGSASHESLQAGMGTTLTPGQGHPIPSGTLTLGRHSSMRPARPIPPPPPPPVNLDTEETHL